MPVISPRRASTSGSSGLYGSTTSSRSTVGDSGPTSSVTNRYSSFIDRAGSLSKVGSSSSSSYTPSSYSSFLNTYPSSNYIPRTSAYRNPSSASSYLSGGSSALDNYRSSSYLGHNDSTSYSRYGLRNTQKPNTESLTKDTHDQSPSGVIRRNETRKPPTGASSSDKRLSSSCSSSSLARLVATSGLDIYEKYSPAHYKPCTELSRSSSALSETTVANATTDEDTTAEYNSVKDRDRRRKEVIADTTVILESPRSRYSRLHSRDIDTSDDTVDNVTAILGSRKKNIIQLADSSSSSDVPTATFTLRRNSSSRASKPKSNEYENEDLTAKLITKSISNRNENLKNGISSTKIPEIRNGVVDDLTSSTKSQLRLSSSTSALNNNENDRRIERSASDSGNIGGIGIGGRESESAITNLDVPTTLNVSPKTKVQQKQQHHQQLQQQQQHLKQTTTSKTVAPTVKKQSSSIYSELKPALSIRQIGGNLSGRSVGIGRGIPIAARIETAQRISSLTSSTNKNQTGAVLATTTATTTATPTTKGAGTTTTTTTPTIASTLVSNAVRKANQQFFLLPDFQDKNFLKHECAIAHAQVASPTKVTPLLGKRTVTVKNVTTRKSTVTKNSSEPKDVVGIKQINNNHINNSGSNNSITSSLLQQQELARSNSIKASVTNVMRRNICVGSGSAYGNSLDTTTTTTKAATKIGNSITSTTQSGITSHRFELHFNGVESSLHSKAPTSTIATTKKTSLSSSPLPFSSSSTSSNSNGYNAITGKGNSTVNSKATIKPLVHRPINTIALENNRVTGGESQSYSNKVNNNGNSGHQLNQSKINTNNNHFTNTKSDNNNGHLANNNSMAATLDQDDIKYIDSDENTGMTLPASATALSEKMGKFVECVEPPISTLISKPTSLSIGTRTRPKSTIVCSNNYQVFEKMNNYKLTNGNASMRTGSSEAASSAISVPRRPLNTNIDSNSIKASIEKFNTFSEQKRLPLANAVTLRTQAGATGSTSNLQSHRHSGSDFDSTNLRQFTNVNGNTGGGSLTRNPYRVSSALTSNSGGGCATQNAPLKAKVRMSDATVAASTATATTHKSTNKQYTVTTTTESRIGAGEEIIRSATTKSVLPPVSPTSSRYWDRESNRTSSLSTLSSTHNHLDVDKSLSDEKSEGLCGLRNIGNTCFMNSIIQCLSHTNELTKFLRNYSGMRSSTSSKDQQILQEFAKLIREMWTSNVHSVTPMELKRAFSSKHRMYSDYNQQDAQEFLRFFLDSLHSALNSGVKSEPLKIDDNSSDNKKAELTWEWCTRHENSLIRDLFVGQLKSTLRCTTCGNTSVTFDPFWDLSVSLPSSSRCKLDACLELFIREEVLDGDEMPTCAKCKTRRKCTKSFSIQRFPKYLVIHLKRFSETRWSKLSNIVEFPTGERELNMGPYGANANTNMFYSLYAISNHMGSTAGGHYVALCKHPASRKWHEFNDNIVSDPVSESHLVSSSAYILFYERA